jgi:hypothetical protein
MEDASMPQPEQTYYLETFIALGRMAGEATRGATPLREPARAAWLAFDAGEWRFDDDLTERLVRPLFIDAFLAACQPR